MRVAWCEHRAQREINHEVNVVNGASAARSVVQPRQPAKLLLPVGLTRCFLFPGIIFSSCFLSPIPRKRIVARFHDPYLGIFIVCRVHFPFPRRTLLFEPARRNRKMAGKCRVKRRMRNVFSFLEKIVWLCGKMKFNGDKTFSHGGVFAP